MYPSAPRRARTARLATALVLASLLAGCGIDATDGAVSTFGGGSPTPAPTTTAPLPPCDDSEGGDTGGTVGVDDEPPTCSKPSDTTTPNNETTTTDPDSPTTTEPDTTTTVIDSGSTGADGYVEALAASLAGSEDLGAPVSVEQAECVAPRWVATLDPAVLADLGISPDELADGDIATELDEVIAMPEATEMVAALTDCGIDLQTSIIEEIGAENDLTVEQMECIVDALPVGYIEDLVVIGLAEGSDALDSDPALAEPLTDALIACQ